MTNSVTIYYLANIYLNAAVGFVISVMIIEAFIFLARLKTFGKFRLIHFLRLIPFAKILYDIFFQYDLSRWAVGYGVDVVNRLPFSLGADFGAFFYRPFIPAYSFLDLSIYRIFSVSIADLLTQNAGYVFTLFFVIASLSGSFFFLTRFFMDIRKLQQRHKKILSLEKIVDFHTKNAVLEKEWNKMKVVLVLSPEKGTSPFTFGWFHHSVIIPEDLYERLSNEERDALIAHEIGHIRWKDILAETALQAISSFFWYLPFAGTYRKQIRFSAELACDREIRRYNSNALTLAEVIRKTMETAFFTNPIFSAALTDIGTAVAARLKILLRSEKEQGSWFTNIVTIVLFFAAVMVSLAVLKSRFGII